MAWMTQRLGCCGERMSRRALVVPSWSVLVAVLALLIGGCSAATDEKRGDWDPVVAGMVATASGFQAALLADGELTPAEYERAVLAQVGCMEDAGYVAIGPVPSRGHQIVYNFGAGKSDPDALGTTYDDCYARYLDVVEPVWAYLHQPTEQEKQAEIHVLSSCLSDAGADVPGSPTYSELLDLVPEVGEAGIRCVMESYDVYSAPNG